MAKSREHALALLQKARDDAYVLSRLAADPAAPAWTVGFHAQQAVEKAMKAVLTDRGVEYPYTHNLPALAKLLQEAGAPVPHDGTWLARLTPYGAPLRYEPDPEAEDDVPLDRSGAQAIVEQTIAWAESLLG